MREEDVHYNYDIDIDYEIDDNLINNYKNYNYKNYNYLKDPNGIYENKYFLDLLLSIVSLPILAFVFPFVYIGIKFSSRGPVIIKQPRIGVNGEKFYCYKFRTMYIVDDNDDSEDRMNGNGVPQKPVITKKNDPRLFPFGRYLRKLNIDEFPQIINVLKNEMSFVGPRPYTIDETNYWDSIFDDFHLRYKSKPGISGYAQVNGFRGGNLDELHMRKRLDFDLQYIEKSSLLFDIKIAAVTVLQMLRFKTKAH